MKLLKRISLALVACFTFVLASCGVSQGYADKINDAAAEKNYVLVEDAKKALGDDCIEALVLNTGFIAQVKGCKTKEELDKVINEGKTAKGIIIVVVGGKCMGAAYGEINEQMIKDAMSGKLSN